MYIAFNREDVKLFRGYPFVKDFLAGKTRKQQFLDSLHRFKVELQEKVSDKRSLDSLKRLAEVNSNPLFFEVNDGTSTDWAGNILGRVLQELGKIHDMIVIPIPEERDVGYYKFMLALGKKAYVPQRKQIDINLFYRQLEEFDWLSKNPQAIRIFLFEQDLFVSNRNSWCFGFSEGIGQPNISANIYISTARVSSDYMLFDIIGHEIGHILDAAPKGRSNTYEHLGSHCSNQNQLCVMVQKDEVPLAIKYAQLRKQNGAPLYCPQCCEDIRRYRSNCALDNLQNIRFYKIS